MMPPMRPRLAGLPGPAGPTRQQLLRETLSAQVTALMLNSQRYEMRAAGYLAGGYMQEAQAALQAADSFAEQAFQVISLAMEDLPPPQQDPPRTRDEAIAREFPDVANRRPRNPEYPDVDDDPSEVDVVVDAEGHLLRRTGEQDI